MDRKLSFDCWQDAVKHDITTSGKTLKEIAHRLKPSYPIDKAHFWLLNKLNTAKDWKLSLEEIALICNECNSYQALYYFEQLCNHHHSKKKENVKINESENHKINQITEGIMELMANAIKEGFKKFPELIKHDQTSIDAENIYTFRKKESA